MQKQDFQFVRGDDVSYRLLLLQGDNTPLNLSNATFDLHARTEESDEPVLQLSSRDGTIEPQENGRLLLHFRHDATQQADWTKASYDLQLQQQGKRTTILYGKIKLIEDQTRTYSRLGKPL